MKGPGEQKLQRAIRQVRRPTWMTTRLAELRQREAPLTQTLQFYQVQKAKKSINVEPEILIAIQEISEELEQIREERQALLLGYQQIQDTAEHAEL